MILKLIISFLAFANGLFMTIDGFHVLVKGKYIGPEKPGPWSFVFYKLKIDVFKLGPLFIVFGLGWLFFTYALWANHSWIFTYGVIIAISTLWYIKIGTFIAVTTIALLFILRQQLGL